ncbi:hypothetical protein [Mycobacterium arosiense]|uniref:Uncharacterized protein n=1 Tax=Mycobacterium arosiense ATCC BAA-1401 = DSM 45069 TaxID=1265311 RepID=A0A1W9ZLU9_MYCAI|nr:hypothetical protein [Mycobacterium arosiense]ORA18087.1 hypothetical protein BST14_08135 [Mycobacterium arosiense ATCC BAA-1401 = DSM 45069]
MNIRSKKLDEWDIPEDVKQYIRDLRQENGRLRVQLKGKGMQVRPAVDMLPVRTRNELQQLRAENAKWRNRFREAQTELAELKAAQADV